MLFGYTLDEARKAVIAAIILGGSVAALLLTGYDGSLTDALVILAGEVFAVVGVFMATNHTPGDLNKAVMAALGATITVIELFTQVHPNLLGKLGAIVTAGLGVYWIYQTRNEPVPGVTKLGEG